MRLEFIGDTLEKAVAQEIIAWSKDVLEKPSKFFNGFPPCPYAKQAWMNDKVAFVFKREKTYQDLYSVVSCFNDKFDLAILVDLNNNKTSEEFHTYLDEMNTAISKGWFIDKDIWVVGFHPDDDATEFAEEADFEALVEVEYSLIFIQRLSKLQESAHRIKKNGYYDNYSEEYNASHIFKRREELYRRLQNGNGP